MKKFRSKFSTIAVIFVAITMILSGCTTDSGGKTKGYTAGKYTAAAKGQGGDVKVEVTLTEEKIDKIEVLEEKETEGLGKPALAKVAEEIIADQSLNVDVVTGATNSSKAIIEAVAIAVDQAGGDSAALKEKKKEVVKGKDEEITTEVVVVGGGGAGTAAALAAAEKGAKVVVLEKGENPGGAARYLAEGLLAVESKQQKEAKVDLTVDEAYKNLMEYTHYLSNADLTKEILELSASTIDWMASMGTETVLMENTQKVHDELPDTYHKYVDKHKAYDTMYSKLKEMGGTLYTNTAGKELIQESDGSISGIIGEKADGGKLTVHAKKVILATGGYAGSADELDKHTNLTNYGTMAYANNVGDGINMALVAGADDFNINTVAYHTTVIPSKDPKIWQGSASTLLSLPLMWVNREGNRFVDEGIVYDFALSGNVTAAQGGEYYVIVDDTTMKELSTKGSKLTHTMEKTYMVGAGVDTKLATGVVAPIPDLYESMESTIEAGFAFKGETIEVLAKELGVDANNLKQTVETYNKAVKDGKDSRFLKPDEYLEYGVENGPYYAVMGAPLVENSDGGVRVNSSLMVLNDQFKPIPNLYAVGCDAGGMYGDSYPIYEGLTLSFAFNSGRLAGYSVAETLDK